MKTVKVSYPFGLTFLDYPNAIDHAVIIYMIGCDNNCISCHNLKFKDINYGEDIKELYLSELIDEIKIQFKKNKTNKLILSGGDPLAKNNIEFTKNIIHFINKNVCIYTGKSIDFVKENNVFGFEYIKCGTYDETNKQISEKTDNYIQFASKNQELYGKDYKQLSINGRYYF